MAIQTELRPSAVVLPQKSRWRFSLGSCTIREINRPRELFARSELILILGTSLSLKGVPIRLTEERWEHVLDHHAEFSYSDYSLVLEAIESPEYILLGRNASLIAVVALGPAAYLHVFYKELGQRDGFVITAAIRRAIDKAKIIWRQ